MDFHLAFTLPHCASQGFSKTAIVRDSEQNNSVRVRFLQLPFVERLQRGWRKVTTLCYINGRYTEILFYSVIPELSNPLRKMPRSRSTSSRGGGSVKRDRRLENDVLAKIRYVVDPVLEIVERACVSNYTAPPLPSFSSLSRT